MQQLGFMTKHWKIIVTTAVALLSFGGTLKAVEILEKRMTLVEAAITRLPYIEGKLDILITKLDK